MIYDVFISYSHQDSTVADDICHLLDDVGVHYYIDNKGINAGSNFSDEIADVIRHCRVFLLLISSNSMKSGYVNKELHYFIDKKLPSAQLIPYKIDRSILKEDWGLILSDIHYRIMDKEPIAPYLIHDILSALKHPIPAEFAIHVQTVPDKHKWRYMGQDIDVLEQPKDEDDENLPVAEVISGIDVLDVDTSKNQKRGIKSWPAWVLIYLGIILLLVIIIVIAVLVNSGNSEDDIQDQDEQTTIRELIVNADSEFVSAEKDERHGNFLEAIDGYNAAFEVDSLRALCGLGRCYQYESFEYRNDSIAMRYFERAADAESPEGLYRLGCCHRDRRGVSDTDPNIAFNYFILSAKLGYVDAMSAVADCYKDGYGTSSSETSYEYWKREYDEAMNSSRQ